MASDYDERRKERLEELRRKLKAREGNKAFKENCQAIRKEIARLEILLEPEE